ncbi:hypothetical protein [Flavobacterium terrisoli]|uniref:hypothetical protein n=1 Tax=Flavobacterium terrisoli TaxID=3242195 RepID=UPI0025439DCF|nr:hypothetical protein [Flavobacterium buctense]
MEIKIVKVICIALLSVCCNAQTDKKKVGDKIYGDFNGDGKFEYAFSVLTKKGKGNPVEDGVPDGYQIQFSDKKIKSIKVDCCSFRLINEGDLNKNGSDEISIVQAPMNGCSGLVSTFTIKNDKSYYLFEPFSIFICAELSDEEIQKLVFIEKDYVYYLEADPNDENLLNESGEKIRFERLRKIKTNVKAISKNAQDALDSIKH